MKRFGQTQASTSTSSSEAEAVCPGLIAGWLRSNQVVGHVSEHREAFIASSFLSNSLKTHLAPITGKAAVTGQPQKVTQLN